MRSQFYYEVWFADLFDQWQFDSQFSTGALAYKRLKEVQKEKALNGRADVFVKIKKYAN